jgi:hypothetical protein
MGGVGNVPHEVDDAHDQGRTEHNRIDDKPILRSVAVYGQGISSNDGNRRHDAWVIVYLWCIIASQWDLELKIVPALTSCKVYRPVDLSQRF